MKWSTYFLPTLKETPAGTEAISHKLLLRAGLVHMLTSGVYSYLPLGWRVLGKIEAIIREEMNAAGAHELLMPAIQPLEIWQQTGRDKTLEEVMIRFKNKKGTAMCLGPTHEEIITDLVKSFVQSYRQLPVTLYQIQTKFRDETRPRFGVVRACEFIMKDAYSFGTSLESLQKSYDAMFNAYNRIFARCGLRPIIAEADSGAMGGKISHEFLVPAAIGEDKAKDETGAERQCIEVGHIFQLGTKYSEALGALFLDEKGQQKPIIMGCYGIGVSRLIATIIEVHNDDKGIKWPREVAPFTVELLPLQGTDLAVMGTADAIYDGLTKSGIDVLMDDRDESAGRKFNDADLIGLPYRITIGKRTLQEGNVEIKDRSTGVVEMVPKDAAVQRILALLGK
ncbi:MAG: proline--tRNA ligase [Candidatus Omnitrophica bacterium]|nr:proline--tRNA ligase [Candidatus Omnitrophota bacterium]